MSSVGRAAARNRKRASQFGNLLGVVSSWLSRVILNTPGQPPNPQGWKPHNFSFCFSAARADAEQYVEVSAPRR